MRAILSVHDKQGLAEFSCDLADLGFELLATGRTARTIAEAGATIGAIEDLTGLPEMLDGRVKTLHPAIHAGLLADRTNPDHLAQLERFGFAPIDLVAVNLYPFQRTIERPGVDLDEAVEQIDIGGVTLLRAAAKNFRHVVVIVDPADYPEAIDRLRAGAADESWRRKLAAKAFQHVAAYDTHIAGYLRGPAEEFPDVLTISLAKLQDLRYGENPHQRAALYAQTPNPRQEATIAGGKQLHGRELSFNNLLDVQAALDCVRDFGAITVSVIKHGNPCGLACSDNLAEAYRQAHDGDPLSSFGGAVGLNRVVDRATAELIGASHYDDIVAPGFTEDALALLRKRKNVRIVEVDFSSASAAQIDVNPSLFLDFRRIEGGFLVQTPDALSEDDVTYRVVTERLPTPSELGDLLFAWRAVKHVRSNAIVLARGRALVGVGAGQMSRVDSTDLAIRKAGGRARGSVLASDAFFSHPDGPELAAKAGITAIIQPGGSVRDDEIINVANAYQIAMLMTGRRHFRH